MKLVMIHLKLMVTLDFSLFNFNEIDKINQDLMPISYFKFDSKTTYKSLISNFEKEGYECIPSK